MKPVRLCAAVLLGLAALSPVLLTCHVRAQDAAKTLPAKKDAVDETTVRVLITQLGDDVFDRRQAAEKQLAGIGEPALEPLRKAAKESADPEIRSRAKAVVLEIEHQSFHAILEKNRWGLLVDPDRDCAFRLEKDALHVKIPPKAHVLTSELGITNAPRVWREIEGDCHAEVTVLGAMPADARSLLSGRWPFYGAGLLVWQDERNYIRLERARMYYVSEGMWRCYVNWEIRQDGKVERWGRWEDGVLDPQKPAHLRLDRSANTFTASYSQDGKEWKELPPIHVEFRKKSSVGVAAIQNTPSGYEAIFKGLKVMATGK